MSPDDKQSDQRMAAEALSLMTGFAERTGVSSARPPRRYLWTDAFAVCNFLGLGRVDLARRLVGQVHHVLGRHRPDEPRQGWLGAADEQSGEAHPTRGGLRIGKPLPERREDEPLDEDLEWERDGQYFHYLTRWMHALDQTARSTGDARFNVWARELASAAHRAFVHGRRMAWKMSIDLSRPLVPSTGQHDPLDGFVTCVQLEATAVALGAPEQPDLGAAIHDFAGMIRDRDFSTTDPLGLGGLLVDASRVAQLASRGAPIDPRLAGELVSSAAHGLSVYARQSDLRRPASHRLAFRELGLAIGLRALDLVDGGGALPYARLGEAIESFWREPEHRETVTWAEHRDINDVMLATALRPEGYLLIP